ncbi:protein Simiate [Orussus abietinus]|uniref:protein Simiate n=1 Tax=Orussus abietinus TaxID=222816 RepID=UPI000625E84C|nr:protein Simiate [Orussus abietinus]
MNGETKNVCPCDILNPSSDGITEINVTKNDDSSTAAKKLKLGTNSEVGIKDSLIRDSMALDSKDSKIESDADSESVHSGRSDIADDDLNHDFPTEGPEDILQSVDLDEPLPTITERYFTPYYQVDIQKPCDDICIRIHSNRICMLSLASGHTLLQGEKKITNVNFKVSNKLDRTLNKVSGKSKHGAQPLQHNSNICFITRSDGETYAIKCCMIGKLVEVNEMLVENPELLRESPHQGGYLALILPKLQHLETLKSSSLTQEAYDAHILKRQEICNQDQCQLNTSLTNADKDAG